MLDVCPSCRIQAAHRSGRTACPRCGGALVTVDDVTRQPIVDPDRPRPAPPNPVRPPAYTQRPQRRPMSARPRLRWVANRPPAAIPPIRQRPSSGPRPTPRYTVIPRWGLHDLPIVADTDSDRMGARTSSLVPALLVTGAAFVLLAIAQLARYIILAVNRSQPVSGWLESTTRHALWWLGLLAAVSTVLAFVVFVRWLLELRADCYREVARVDPRPWWIVVPLAVIPVVNIVGLPFLLAEAVTARAGGAAELDARTRGRLQRLAIAWLCVNVVAGIAGVWRILAASSASIQLAADAMVWVAVGAAVSAAFSFWVGRRLTGLCSVCPDPPNSHDSESAAAASVRRMVVVSR